ncbi:laminin EGF domain-containing protein [Ditylenchus destructor]|nr:laminin EGF domain-containing protein [Ditylenchus destructor]
MPENFSDTMGRRPLTGGASCSASGKQPPKMQSIWIYAVLALCSFATVRCVVLTPPNWDLAHGRRIEATYTCGEVNGRPVKEMYCTIAGASPYTPYSQYSYRMTDDEGRYKEVQQKESFLHAGQNCDYCMANSSQAHPASNMVDGSPAWYQSPPLSRGMQYREINITIDLEQEFHVAYVWIQMANSPRPGTWILEHSIDFGKTWNAWQYFASSPAECSRLFGIASLSPITEDDSVICTSEYSSIHPMENGEYFYGIKEILMGGRCVCNGHADSCDVLDVNRPRARLCRCDHNTCGDNCERCCDGFVQKKWRPSRELDEFGCEPCNCFGHSLECVYDEEVEASGLSLDVHGNYSGGGRCLNCQDNTEGINCNKCKAGFHRPLGKNWSDRDVCQPCVCDPEKHTSNCAEETGECECKPQFTGPNCDQCAEGYYHPPECRPCECNVNGTVGGVCLPVDGICPCKEGFGGKYCDVCSPGYTNITAGCVDCNCDNTGSLNTECNVTTSQCVCKSNYGGKQCEKCANGYFNHPACDYCDCDPSGTEGDICDQKTGQCLCKLGFSGRRCDQCDENYFGYPNCKECACNPIGSKTETCDSVSGECPCLPNFTSRTCDRCAAKYYRYPECLDCGCHSAGSKGVTCDNDGQCYCKPNFEGSRCDRCKEKLYNFPICEECNCHPSGVIAGFAGCDKVAPGELCICRENVIGRTCSQCKPTFWDLQAYHDKGCVDCNCNKTGTLSLLNSCDQHSGQCTCKRHVSGQKCDLCADGFFNMRSDSQIGCQACNCDVGGAIGTSCNQNTGQCRCRPRIDGLKCDRPIQDHYFPTLWQHKYEAEEGRLPDGKPLRFAIDPEEFPNFSWRGFTVFSPIQDEIVLEVDIRKSAVYKLLFHYKNPTDVPVDVEVKLTPFDTKTPDFEQTAKAVLDPAPEPTNKFINTEPLVLNVGKWHLKIKSPKRLFLDYIVLVPAEYYTGSTLSERIYEPCHAIQDSDKPCIELLYPPLPAASRIDAVELNRFTEVPDTLLPDNVAKAALVKTDPDSSKEIRVDIDVPDDDFYYLVVKYFNLEEVSVPVKVRIEQDDVEAANGHLVVNHCPYAYVFIYKVLFCQKNCFRSLCRELLSSDGRAALFNLRKSPPNARVIFSVQPGREFGLSSINLVRQDVWSNDYLHQLGVCVRKNGKCVGQLYELPPNSIVTEAESGANVNSSISGDKLPFVVDDAANLRVMSIDNAQSTLDVDGVVAKPGEYVFVVHFFSPDNVPITATVLVQNERFADANLYYCPSTTGCRTIVTDKQNTGQNYFHIDDKYTLTFYYNNSQKGPIYIDYVIAVPYETYSDSVLKPQALDISEEFTKECAEENFANHPERVSDYCKQKVFSLTSEFNTAALPCECNPQGSLDFTCVEYGGQCKCKENVIGRTCDRCSPGFYNYPECIKCKCSNNQQCDERSGQCFCPRYVEGQQCDRCVKYAFGYDLLIGCQLCGCNQNGSHNGELECDSLTGQCLCKGNVGGRRCDKCLPGYYGFPHCYECTCEDKGTTDDVCDVNNAQCLCKKNVIGPSCDTCRPGTFDLRKSDIYGCSECFCFSVTDRCHSSNFPVQTMSFDDQSWTSDDPNGKIQGSFGRIVYTATEDENGRPTNVYLEAPIVEGKDYTTSYGLHLSYIITSIPSNPEKPSRNTAYMADVRLVSGDTTLEYFSSEQAENYSKPFKVVVTLFPEYWVLKTGEPASKAQLMMTLLKLEKVLVKASYYEMPSKAILEQFELETAEDDPRQDGLVSAPSVELCECPPPYAGPSCQFCAPGYYRVATPGSLLGSCVPCNCHGHSGTCDPVTGTCSDCQHSTEGDHCETCIQGFYGNATTGSPSSCLRCACPYPSETNNFALSCLVSERGILERCVCQKGYSGDRCETCDVGFFGEPLQPGGTCEPCFCSNNNDLNEDGACNPRTGDCALCEGNTDGRRCEYCKEWYYGDAVTAKNCTECKCDQCGSYECDNILGQCQCHPLVEGSDCSRCAENAWGFDSCRGCRPCNCGAAASNSQCDLKTGQCACMPGAGGQFCERCEHGYWNYSPQGCKKCDCESDLSQGTVCDVTTGQCHCQPGASGPRCDSCVENYLKVPTIGCRFCDECVFALNSEMDNFDMSVEVLASTLGNVSSVALTGARLKRIQKSIAELEPNLDQVISVDSDVNELTEIIPKISSVKDSSSNIAIRADRSADQLEAISKQLDASFDQLSQLRQDTNDLIEVSNWQISKVVDLKENFESSVPVENREQMIADAERILGEIKANEDRTSLDSLSEQLANITNTLTQIETLKNKSQELLDQIKAERGLLQTMTNTSLAFRNELHTTQSTINDSLESLSLFALKALINGIDKDSSVREKNISAIQEKLTNISELVQSIQDYNETINRHVLELSELKSLVSTKTDRRRRMRRDVEKNKFHQKVKELEDEANRISGIYGAAELESTSAVKAANVYKDLMDTLKNAKNYTSSAMIVGSEARKRIRGKVFFALLNNLFKIKNFQKESSKSVREKSEEINKKVQDLEMELFNELKGRHQTLQEKVDSLLPTLEKTVRDYEQLNLTIPDNLADIDRISEISDTAHSNLLPINESFAKLAPLIQQADERVKQLIDSNLNKEIPNSLSGWEEVKARLDNTSSMVEDCRSKLALLKEKIVVARDKANRVW